MNFLKMLIFPISILTIMIVCIIYSDFEEKRKSDIYTGQPLLNYIKNLNTNNYKISLDSSIKVKKFIVVLLKDSTLTHFINIDKCINSELKTNNTNEIENIILISIDKKNVGSYESGADAIRLDYKISLLDVNSKTIFYQSQIVGYQPKDTIYRKYNLKEVDELGKLPTDDITCYTIEKLINHINHIQ